MDTQAKTVKIKIYEPVKPTPVKSTPEMWQLTKAALRETITAHGPITHKLVPSAVQRVLSVLLFEEILKKSPLTANFIVEMLNIKYVESMKPMALKMQAAAKEHYQKRYDSLKTPPHKAQIDMVEAEIRKIYEVRLAKKSQEFHDRHQEMDAVIQWYRNRDRKELIPDDPFYRDRWVDDGGRN